MTWKRIPSVWPSGRSLTWMLAAVLAWAGDGLLPSSVARADAQAEYNLGLRLYEDQRWDQAARQFRKFLDEAPQHEKAPLAELLLGQSFVHQRQFNEARDVFRRFVQSHAEHDDLAWAMYRVGECSYFLNDFAAARDELKAYLNKAPKHELVESALQFLGESELRLNNPPGAAQAFEQCLKQFPKGALADETRFGLARAYEALGRNAEALESYRLLAANPQSPRAAEAQFNLGAQLFEDGDHEQAAEAFQAVVERFPQHRLAPLARLNEGFSRYYLQDYEAAISRFEEARQADPKLGGTAAFWTGLSLKSQGDFPRASQVLLDEFQRDQSQELADRLLFHAADSQLRNGSYGEAVRLFLDVARRWPQSELADDSLHSATEAALRDANLEQAESVHRQFEKSYPESGLRLAQQLIWGRVLMEQGDRVPSEQRAADPSVREQARQKYRDAAQQFEQVLMQSQLDSTRDLARLQLARAWERLDNHQRVIETLKPLLDQTPPGELSLQAVAVAGQAWLALDKFEEAARAAEQVLQSQQEGDQAGQALANLAVARAHQNRLQDSLDALKRLAAIDPEHKFSNRARYEVGEVAYEAKDWPSATELFRGVIEQGASGAFYAPAVSGLAYSLHEAARVDDDAAQLAESEGHGDEARRKLVAATNGFNEAAQWFSRLRTLTPGNRQLLADAVYMQGLSLKFARRPVDAAKVFEEGLREFAPPEDAGPLTPGQLQQSADAYRCAKGAARAWSEAGETTSADKAYAAAFRELKRQPADRQQELDLLINEWALLNYKAGDFGRSDELFRLLIKERPESDWTDDARLLLAESDFFAERLEDARSAFRELVADKRADDFVRQRSLVLLLDIGARLDDWEDVNKVAEEFVASFPQSEHRAYADYRLGEARLRDGKLVEAEQSFQSLLDRQHDPSLADAEWFPSVWLMQAEASLGLKKYDRVREIAEQFRQRFSESPFTYHLDDVVGRSYLKQARFDEAREAFQRVIESPHGESTETAAKAQFYIAESYLTQKRYEEAFDAYYRVLNYGFPEWHAPSLLQAGRCDERLKRWTGAAKTYEKLISEFPQTEYAEQAMPLLRNVQSRLSPTSTQ